MPLKNTKKEKRPPAHETGALSGYWSRHPEEHRKHQAQAKARDESARVRRMAKHQPKLTDIQDNGQYVDVTFVRNNGKLVWGTYKLINAAVPADFNKLELNRAARFAARIAVDEAQGKPLPEPGKTPQS